LRRLAAGRADRVEATLQQAFADLARTVGATKRAVELRALIDSVAETFPPGLDPNARGEAFWRVVQAEARGIEPRDERAAVVAALHLDSANRESSIDKRLIFARDRGGFGTTVAGQPQGYDALRRCWGRGVRRLGHAVDNRLAQFRQNPEGWRAFVGATYRIPFDGAQPVFADLFVTTVFMKGRLVDRRVTERLVTAMQNDVQYYTAWSLPENDDPTSSVPVQAIWGCRTERMPASPGEPVLTKLWFPRPLRRGEQHFFSSEARIAGTVNTARRAVNVEVDHHGIAPGRILNSVIPVSGLTIRVSFDPDDLPDALWWYADVPEQERYIRPRLGEADDRWVEVTSQGFAAHTFADACQPRANYGLAIAWPVP
jgi:hypothetical protein